MEKKYTLLKVNGLLLLSFIWTRRFYFNSVETRRHANAHSCLPVYPLCWIHAGVSCCINGVRGEKGLRRFFLFHTTLPPDCQGGCENPIGCFYMDKSSFGNRGLSGHPCLCCRGAWWGKMGNFKDYLQTTVQQEDQSWG